MREHFTAWQPTVKTETGEIYLPNVDITIQPLTLAPEPTYWNLEHLRSLETYKHFSNWTEQRKWYHHSDFYLLLYLDMACQERETEFEDWLREIWEVGQLQRRVECGYYKFTPKQVATVKTLSEIKASEMERGVYLDAITVHGTISYPNTMPQEMIDQLLVKDGFSE